MWSMCIRCQRPTTFGLITPWTIVRQSLAKQNLRSYSNTPSFFLADFSTSTNKSTTTKSHGNIPARVAVVGSGPSGMYTAKYLKLAWEKAGQPYQISILEKLPTPYGLVRYGVAPDHPEVKNVQNDFQTLLQSNVSDDENHASSSSSFIQYLGNVHVGRDISLQELRQTHDAVVLATGCESDRTLELPITQPSSSNHSRHQQDQSNDQYSTTNSRTITSDNHPSSSLKGILSAREFVAWYNGHPEYNHIGKLVQDALVVPDHQNQEKYSTPPDGDQSQGTSIATIREVSVVVIGQGNVALDCARILAKGGTGLYDTDMAAHALPILGKGVRQITVVGRRGHVQGAFTIKELRELVQLQEEGHDTQFIVREDELDRGATAASFEELDGPGGRPKKRIDKLLRKAAANSSSQSTSTSTASKRLDLRFLLSPSAWEADESDSSRLGGVVCERTRLEGEAGQQQAVGTGEMEHIPAQLALVSIGYKGLPMPGLDDRFFDSERGVLRHEHGRVDNAVSDNNMGGLYAAGWIKRGPSGIIGTNIPDARDTVNTILQDLEEQKSSDSAETTIDDDDEGDLKSLLAKRGVEVVDWEAYMRIEAQEAASKRSEEQPREKISNLQEQVDVALGRR